jgi:mediator of RNA polymerase II transcription subunit 12, fungi type
MVGCLASARNIFLLINDIIIDLPRDPKLLTYDPFTFYPAQSITELPKDIPSEYRAQLYSILPDFPSISLVTDLAVGYRNKSKRFIYESMAVNKPWEWMENLGESPVVDPKDKDDDTGIKAPITNSGSLSLQLFAARKTGDSVVADCDIDDSLSVQYTRMFEDGISAESVFIRDWRESRLPELEAPAAHAISVDIQSDAEMGSPERRTPAGSPASIPSGSRRPSPALSTTMFGRRSNTNTPSATSSVTKKSHKRKASMTDDDDDDDDIIFLPQIVDPPPKAKKRR